MGKCWHEWLYEGTCKHCGATRIRGGVTFLQECAWSKNTDFGHPIMGFFIVKAWMEKNMPKEWEKYLFWGYCNGAHGKGEDAYTSSLSYQLNLSNLVAFLVEHREEWQVIGNENGFIFHPALVWWDKQKEVLTTYENLPKSKEKREIS